jgi:hypothetical protein
MLGFLAGSIKMVAILLVELLSTYSLIVTCDFLSLVTAFLRFFAISTFDAVVFASMAGVPFINEVNVPCCILTIDTTSSEKNNWANCGFIEKFGVSNKA